MKEILSKNYPQLDEEVLEWLRQENFYDISKYAFEKRDGTKYSVEYLQSNPLELVKSRYELSRPKNSRDNH